MADQINFSLSSISTEQFAILEDNYTDGIPVQLGFELGFGYNEENRMIAPFFKSNFIQQDKRFIILEVACHFQIAPESWVTCFDNEKKNLRIPKGFAQHLAILTLGTARGILHAKTESTKYNRFFLPTVNVQQLVKDDVILND